MRWKLLRRRLSISAPRVIVRSHLPWPLRWVAVAVVLGFSAAIAVWAFEFGKDIAGLDGESKDELARLRIEVAQLRDERAKALAGANSAESLLKAEAVARDRLAKELSDAEAENLELKADLGFFRRLLPAVGAEGLSIRALQAEQKAPGRLRFQLLVMQNGKLGGDFVGQYEVLLAGTLDGKPWTFTPKGGAKRLQLRQYVRVEGVIVHPEQAVVKTVQVRVSDPQGNVLATQSVQT
jgi:hypothetical protein